MNIGKPKWINTYVQAHSKPPPIPLIRSVTLKIVECNIVNIKMFRDPVSATSKTYDLKFPTFKNCKPGQFLQIVKDFNTATGGTGTMSATGKIHFLRTLLRKEDQR